VRQKVGVLLLAYEPSSDGVEGKGRLADAVAPDETGGDIVEQGASTVS
jgi:hypothetical protein